MRIAINTRFLLSTKLEGFGWFTYEVSKRLAEQHPEHEFVFFFDRPFDKRFVFAENVEPVVLFPPARHPILFRIWFNFSVTRALKKHKIDLFFSPDGYLSLRTKVPQIAVIHDLNFEHFPNDLPAGASKYLRHYFPLFAKKAAKIITVSEFSAQDIVRTYGIEKDKIRVAYNGVSDQYNPLANLEKLEIREKYSRSKSYFLFVGSLHPRKNIIRLLAAYEQYAHRGGLMDMVIVGENLWNSNKSIADPDLKLKERIHFTSYIEQRELIKVMGAADIFVYVPYFEGFGIPILEAMRSGVPVISGNLTSLPEVGGEAALYCDPLDVNDICSKMIQLENDKELQKNLIEKGLKRAAEFSWQKSADIIWEEIIAFDSNAKRSKVKS